MVHACLEFVVFGAADVLVTVVFVRTHLFLFYFICKVRKQEKFINDIHWLDDMPLTLVLITAADAGCTGMCSGESRAVSEAMPMGLSYCIISTAISSPVALNFTSFAFFRGHVMGQDVMARESGSWFVV
jgi:hypothetical protein